MTGNKFNFGSKPRMKEVQPGQEAVFTFKGDPEIVETEYGEKYSFPISLISHDQHPLLKDGPMDMVWESKCQAAKQLYNHLIIDKTKFTKELWEAYKKNKWQLTRFDTGAYFIGDI
jgi:hypothetical protein